MVKGKSVVLITVWLMLGWITAVSANNQKPFDEEDLIKESASVSEAISNIRHILEQQEFDIIGVVDHAAGAASVGMDLRPTQLILFSDRRQENKLIHDKQTLAIDLPLKILVWEDGDGTINFFYNGPGYLIDRHRLQLHDHHLEKIAKSVRQFGDVNNGLITVDSPFSVEQTVENLRNAIEALADRGFRVPFVIDFLSDGQHEFAHLSATTLLIFGNPNAGTPLMQNQQRIGVDLPQKFLVWEDQYGQTHITYNDISFLAERHDLQGVEQNLENISTALANFVKVATQE
ncbi:MAG: hypothetical protein NMNS01_08470 [Nitrosomonas sp.]|nr:MAG: hypothetical protein NMNS01_08470 [Nitrosomonas sp.]